MEYERLSMDIQSRKKRAAFLIPQIAERVSFSRVRNLRKPIAALIAITLVQFAIHFYAIAYFPSLIDDEVVYVGAAQLMLSHTLCTPLMETTCNLVHPPLGKLLIASSIALFGNSPFGARVLEAVMGSVMYPLVFFIASRLSGNDRIGLLAIFILSFDLSFNFHTEFAFLESSMIFFVLLGIFSYFEIHGPWTPIITGVLLGLGVLSKETALFPIVGFLTYILIVGKKSQLRNAAIIVVLTGTTFVIGLQLYDSFFTTFPTFIQNLQWSFDSFRTPTLGSVPSVSAPHAGFPGLIIDGIMTLYSYATQVLYRTPLMMAAFLWVPSAAWFLFKTREMQMNQVRKIWWFSLTMFISNFLGFGLLFYVGRGAYDQYLAIELAFSSIGLACMVDLFLGKMNIVNRITGAKSEDRKLTLAPEQRVT